MIENKTCSNCTYFLTLNKWNSCRKLHLQIKLPFYCAYHDENSKTPITDKIKKLIEPIITKKEIIDNEERIKKKLEYQYKVLKELDGVHYL